eukprot:scaffold508_cov554-Prasinococcus_capsulatus_cf.AAC.13
MGRASCRQGPSRGSAPAGGPRTEADRPLCEGMPPAEKMRLLASLAAPAGRRLPVEELHAHVACYAQHGTR